MTSNRRPSRSISDVTKFDCQCGHYDCEVILNRKVAALSRRKESLLPSLTEEGGQSQKNTAKSPLPALFCKLSLVPDGEENTQAKRFGKVKKIFFSPHPDDVAYSCFGLASGKDVNSAFSSSSSRQSSNSSNAYSSAGSFATNSTLESNDEIEYSTLFSSLDDGKTETLPSNPDTWLVTVFSKSRCANGPIGQSLRHCVNATTTLRQREDEEFARSIGARLISLGLRDTSARDEGSRHPELLANTKSSLSSLTVNHYKFEILKERVRPFVEWAIECKADIHIPVAVGCHIDHWMVRVAILSILYQIEQQKKWMDWSGTHSDRKIDRNETNANVQKQDLLRRFSLSHQTQSNVELSRFGCQLIFYEDLPYAFLGTDDLIERTVTQFLPNQVRTALIPMTEADWARKKAAVEGYASQMKPTLLNMLNDHAMLLAKRASALDPTWDNDHSTQEWTKAERCWILDDVCGLTGTLLTNVTSNTVEEQTHKQHPTNRLIIQSPKPKVQFLSPFDFPPPPPSKTNNINSSILSPSSRTIELNQFSDHDSAALSLSPTTTQTVIKSIKAFQRIATYPSPDSFPISNHEC